MSRARRKHKQKATKGGVGKKILLWCVFSLIILLIVGVAGSYLYVKSYLKSDEFLSSLSQSAKDGLNVNDATVYPLDWDGAGISSDGVEMRGDELLTELKAEGVSAEFDRWRLLNRSFVMTSANIRKVDVKLRAGDYKFEEKEEESKTWLEEHLLPTDFNLEKGFIHSLSASYAVSDGVYALSGVNVGVKGGEGAHQYRFDLRGGDMKVPFRFCPKLTLSNGVVLYNYDAQRVNVPTCRLTTVNNGYLDVKGDWDIENTTWSANVVVNGVPSASLLVEGLEKYLKGDLSGSVELRGEHGKLVHLAGLARLENGKLSNIPMQDTLADFCNSDNFRQLILHKASLRFTYKDGVWNLTDIVLENDNLIRAEGYLQIGANEELDGRFHIGIKDGVWSLLPGFSSVFTASGDDGYVWAYVNIGGTLDHPTEDLSTRLLKVITDFRKVIPAASTVVDKGKDMLDSILGKKKEAATEETGKGKNSDDFEIPATEEVDKSLIPGLKDATDTGGEILKGLFGL